MDDANIYGWGRTSYNTAGSHIGLNTQLHLFSAAQKPEAVKAAPQPAKQPAANKKPSPKKTDVKKPNDKAKTRKKRRKPAPKARLKYHWTRPAEMYARAMVLADKTLFIAGPLIDQQHLEGLLGRKGAVLRAVSAATGEAISELALAAPPVFDGLAAAEGKLYLSTKDGKITCFTGR